MALTIFIKLKYAHKRPLISLDMQIQKNSSSGFRYIQENMTGYHSEHLLATKAARRGPAGRRPTQILFEWTTVSRRVRTGNARSEVKFNKQIDILTSS